MKYHHGEILHRFKMIKAIKFIADFQVRLLKKYSKLDQNLNIINRSRLFLGNSIDLYHRFQLIFPCFGVAVFCFHWCLFNLNVNMTYCIRYARYILNQQKYVIIQLRWTSKFSVCSYISVCTQVNQKIIDNKIGFCFGAITEMRVLRDVNSH